MRLITGSLLAALVCAPGVAMAGDFAPPRDANNESACLGSGMGMDPRCVGDVDTSQESAYAPAVQEAPQQQNATRVSAMRHHS